MQGDTTTHPEAYLDLGNEFSWAVLKSRPSTLGLQDICSGESRELYLPHRLFLHRKRRGKQTEIIWRKCLYSHFHPQHIPKIILKKKELGNFSSGSTSCQGLSPVSHGIMPRARNVGKEHLRDISSHVKYTKSWIPKAWRLLRRFLKHWNFQDCSPAPGTHILRKAPHLQHSCPIPLLSRGKWPPAVPGQVQAGY